MDNLKIIIIKELILNMSYKSMYFTITIYKMSKYIIIINQYERKRLFVLKINQNNALIPTTTMVYIYLH